MKKVLLTLAIALFFAVGASAGSFDSVFDAFKDKTKAEYVKMPGLVVKMAGAAVAKDFKDIPMNIKMSGLRLLTMEECTAQEKKAFVQSVMNAGKQCELLGEDRHEDGCQTVWLEPKNAKDKKYTKMIVFVEEECVLVELSGTFSPKSRL